MSQPQVRERSVDLRNQAAERYSNPRNPKPCALARRSAATARTGPSAGAVPTTNCHHLWKPVLDVRNCTELRPRTRGGSTEQHVIQIGNLRLRPGTHRPMLGHRTDNHRWEQRRSQRRRANLHVEPVVRHRLERWAWLCGSGLDEEVREQAGACDLLTVVA